MSTAWALIRKQGLLCSWGCPSTTVTVSVYVLSAESSPLAAETSSQVTCESCGASTHSTQIPAFWVPWPRPTARQGRGGQSGPRMGIQIGLWIFSASLG